MAWYGIVETALGPLFVGGSDRGVHRVDFLRDSRNGHPGDYDEAHWAGRLQAETGETVVRDEVAAGVASTQLREFMAGARARFDLPLAPTGTPWQKAVWDALLTIPFGETTSYGEIARRLDRPSASRAVGMAVGRNPIGIVVPCHRVIGSDGSLTGYGGGLARKQTLLDLERSHRQPRLLPA